MVKERVRAELDYEDILICRSLVDFHSDKDAAFEVWAEERFAEHVKALGLTWRAKTVPMNLVDIAFEWCVTFFMKNEDGFHDLVQEGKSNKPVRALMMHRQSQFGRWRGKLGLTI